jgi:hypothetical protein
MNKDPMDDIPLPQNMVIFPNRERHVCVHDEQFTPGLDIKKMDQSTLSSAKLKPQQPVYAPTSMSCMYRQHMDRPGSPTEKMFHDMYQDRGELFFEKMIAGRVPPVWINPSHPESRRRQELADKRRQAWRGFHWSQSP